VNVRAIRTDDDLRALEPSWNRLAGEQPFLSWDWLATWWSVYGLSRVGGRPAKRCLYVLAVRDEQAGDRLLGVLPLYLERTVSRGNLLRLLGTGEVCTDHLSLVCEPRNQQLVATVVAEFLAHSDDWDTLELHNIDANDPPIASLIAALSERGCEVSHHSTDSCWQISIPATWDDYLAAQSKSHRKQLRQAERRVLDSGRAVWHPVHDESEFSCAWNILVDLHQRRRKSLGEPGCFASRCFFDFHEQVARRLLGRRMLRLSWLELDGDAVAAEYHLAGRRTTYAYQGGVDPQRLDEEPGRLSMICCVQAALKEGHTTFDLLRGSEPYKAHWRAVPQPTATYRLVPNRRLARLRGHVLRVASDVVDWMRTGHDTPVHDTLGGTG
jgi:CelD/BcsL family acetyltransferase involved in cellulose biosynthesis